LIQLWYVFSSQSRSTRSAAGCGMPHGYSFGRQCTGWKRQAWYSLLSPLSAHHSATGYIMQTQLGTFKDPTETTSPRLESSQQRTNGQPHTISLARFCCYPPALYTRPTSRCFVPQSGLSYTHTPHAHTSSTLACRSRYRLHSSFPSTRHSLQRTNPLFYIQSPP